VFYTGAAPNQQAIPAVDYLMKDKGEALGMAGTDYVYPRTTNNPRGLLESKGVSRKTLINYRVRPF